MSKICIVGDYDSICAFTALGIDTFEVSSSESAGKIIDNLAQNDYAVILVVESTASTIIPTLDKYRTTPLPAIIPVPGVRGKSSIGIEYLRKAVEQAVGSADMIFGN